MVQGSGESILGGMGNKTNLSKVSLYQWALLNGSQGEKKQDSLYVLGKGAKDSSWGSVKKQISK